MDKRIIYTRPDGGVSVVTPCRNIDEADLTEDAILQRALAKLPADAINPKVVDANTIPSDRTFRNAWEHGGTKVQVNMGKARDMHLERIRKRRDAVLAALDVETMKALGKGDGAALEVVEAQKQKLRDIPQTIDLSKAKTPESLKGIWPEELEN